MPEPEPEEDSRPGSLLTNGTGRGGSLWTGVVMIPKEPSPATRIACAIPEPGMGVPEGRLQLALLAPHTCQTVAVGNCAPRPVTFRPTGPVRTRPGESSRRAAKVPSRKLMK